MAPACKDKKSGVGTSAEGKTWRRLVLSRWAVGSGHHQSWRGRGQSRPHSRPVQCLIGTMDTDRDKRYLPGGVTREQPVHLRTFAFAF